MTGPTNRLAAAPEVTGPATRLGDAARTGRERCSNSATTTTERNAARSAKQHGRNTARNLNAAARNAVRNAEAPANPFFFPSSRRCCPLIDRLLVQNWLKSSLFRGRFTAVASFRRSRKSGNAFSENEISRPTVVHTAQYSSTLSQYNVLRFALY